MSVAEPSLARPRLVPLRIGLVIAALLLISNAIPAVSEIGLTGSGWDVVVITLAIVTPLIALGAVVFGILAWRGARRPAIAVIIMLFISVLTMLPVFFLGDEVPAAAFVVVGITIVGTLGVAALIAVGARVTR
jgi:hypothetical protein